MPSVSAPKPSGFVSAPRMGGGTISSLLYSTWFWVGLLVLVLGGIGLWAVYSAFHKQSSSFHANNERVPATTEATKQVSLMFFFADWCPACKKAKPTWNEIKDKYENTKVNGYTITCEEYDCTDQEASESLCAKYKITSFPTLMLYKNGEFIRYDAAIQVATVDTFVQTNTSS